MSWPSILSLAMRDDYELYENLEELTEQEKEELELMDTSAQYFDVEPQWRIK